MSNRVMQVFLKPGLLGLVAAVVLAFGLTEMWKAVSVSESFLMQDVLERARQDANFRRYQMDGLYGTADKILYLAAGIVWIAAMVWFFVCWCIRIAQVGAVRRLRLHWAWVCALGLVGSLVVAGYFLYELRSTMALLAMAYTVLFVAAFFIVIYYLTTAGVTHRIYLPAVPFSWSRWRPW